MHKSQRLFQLVNLLRGRRTAVTAEQLADVMEVSKRTIYRDIEALIDSGLPIEGEAGVGYMLGSSFQLPPLMFDVEEMQALLLGAQMVGIWTDDEISAGAERASRKIRAVLPQDMLHKADSLPYLVPKVEHNYHVKDHYQIIRKAYETKNKLAIDYKDVVGNQTQRVVWPLAMVFWGGVWTLLAWCEKRDAFRSFRFDRMNHIDTLEEKFKETPERCLQYYIDHYIKGDKEKSNNCQMD